MNEKNIVEGNKSMKLVKKEYLEKAVRAYRAFLTQGFDKEDANDTISYCKKSVGDDVLLWGTIYDALVICISNCKKGIYELVQVLGILGFEVV